MATFSRAQAVRIALAAQGFTNERPESVSRRHLSRVNDRLGVIQIDSVNVVSRSHYLPYFSRLGPYDTAVLDQFRDGTAQAPGLSRRPRPLVEQWAHEASLVPPQTWPYFTFRMAAPRHQAWADDFSVQYPGLLDSVRDAIEQLGPMTARDLASVLPQSAPRDRDHWGWNWSAAKEACEILFRTGAVTSAGRTPQFERLYSSLSHVLRADVVAQTQSPPTDRECFDYMLRVSIKALGIATVDDLLDYFRLRGTVARGVLEELVLAGVMDEVEVKGLGPRYLIDPQAKRPRKLAARALLSPFDSLVWHRPRAEQLFDFRYRLEIYTPAAKRVYGYYVLPFLLHERIVGRVDLKADRPAGVLQVKAVHWEPDAPSDAMAELHDELGLMAQWMGLERVGYA